jgi:hypothetical protein
VLFRSRLDLHDILPFNKLSKQVPTAQADHKES